MRRLLQLDAVLAAATFLLHAALAHRYDFFRDELYFIIAGRHPAFGYVDQPALVPLVAALTQSSGENLFLLRLVPAVAAAATVFVTCAFARLSGGGRFAQGLSGVAVALALIMLALTTTFNTSSFEPLAWTLVAYLIARAVLDDDGRALLWAGVATGMALEIKYEIPFWLLGLAVGLAAVPQRRIFARRELWLGLGIALAIAAPTIFWQAAHGWPFAELLAAAPEKNANPGPLAFVVSQIVVWNPIFAPVWIAGIVAPFAGNRLAPLRWLSIAFVAVFGLMFLLQAKDYYLAGAYPAMLALGASAVERSLRSIVLRSAYLTAGIAVAVVFLPLALPILAPAELAAYMRALHQTPDEGEKSFRGALLPQQLADQLGWREFTRDVAAVYGALPPADRARAAIVTSNYGEAAALDFYGGAYGLPPALSGHNSYYLWGTHGYDGSIVLRVNGDFARYRKLCTHPPSIAGRFGPSPYVMPYEHDGPIILCRGLRDPFPHAWQRFKHYD